MNIKGARGAYSQGMRKAREGSQEVEEEIKRRLGARSSRKATGMYRKKLEELSMKRLGNARVLRGGGTSPR